MKKLLWFLKGLGHEMDSFNAYKIKSVHAQMVFNFSLPW